MSEKKHYLNFIIAGSRNFNDYLYLEKSCDDVIRDALAKTSQNEIIISIISGKAGGADTLGERYGRKRGYTIINKPAKWDDLSVPGAVIRTNKMGKPYNVIAGFTRNKEMLALVKDNGCLIVFWDGKSHGAKDIIQAAKKDKIQTFIFEF